MLGLLLGASAIALVVWVQRGGGGFEEREQYFPRSTPEATQAWTEEMHLRGDAWADVPDPPGDGPVVRARYWLARDRYDMDVRRRGSRFVVAIRGVAEHLYGGGWAAYGEGTITGDARDFRDAVATFSWSCLGLRYRHASDGLGRIVFSKDGADCHAIYMAWEAPQIWAKSYGERHEEGDEPPAYGTIRGQIPIDPVMPRLEAKRTYRADVRVVDLGGRPLSGAIVQLKGQSRTRVQTDATGRAQVVFQGKQALLAQSFAAGRVGYRNGEAITFSGDHPDAGDAPWPVTIELAAIDLTDNPDYAWNHAYAADDTNDAMACGTCHPWHYDQWYESRHARMADSGHVTWEVEQMKLGDPTAPEDCRGCHQPAHAVTHGDAPWKPRGVMAGNHCDFCHKIHHVKDARASGVFGAYGIHRPDPKTSGRPGGIHTVFGSSADATYAYMGASYNPLFQTSHVCAGCHQGGGRWRDGAVPKIDTFEEWKRWAAERPNEEFRSCLDCHMPGAATFDKEGRAMDQMAWDAQHRSPQDVHSHRFLGSEAAFGRHALEVTVTKRLAEDGSALIVDVAVTNSGAGHKVPTGTWSKHVVVGVWAERAGKALKQIDGPQAWLDGSVKTRLALAPGDWRNPAGFILGVRAKSDVKETQGLPRFWQAWPADQIVDRRLAPGATRRASIRFELGTGEGEFAAEVRVLHRRGWLTRGAASVPWTIGPNDPPPEVLWWRIRK